MALPPFQSNLIANIGISMGDEGKGRLVYELINDIAKHHPASPGATTILKVNGGANSGHTAAGLKLNLLPSGITEKNIQYLAIGSGVVADPRKLHWEAKPLEAKGLNVIDRLYIDERTQVSDLTHRLLDLACEDYRVNHLHEEPRGSTGRGITPTFCDETGQWQIFYAAFKGDKGEFAKKLAQKVDRALNTIKHVYKVSPESWEQFFTQLTDQETRANKTSIDANLFPDNEFDFTRFKGDTPFTLNFDALLETYWEAGHSLADRIVDVRELLIERLNKDEFIIGEFGQSYWLDKRQGFTPNVTASHTYTPEFFFSSGLPIQPIHTVACSKAYDTKVGTHTFLTEMPEAHPLCQILKKLEFGTSTGRQRMVGWFDAVEKGDALRYGGFQDLAINKLDVLTYQDAWQGGELLICVAYRGPDGTLYHTVPRDDNLRKSLQPVYRQLPGWDEPISHIRKFNDLPQNAKDYVKALYQSIIEIAHRNGNTAPHPNLRYIGVGADPGEIIQDVPKAEELLNSTVAI